MIILSQNEDAIFDFDKAHNVYAQEGTVYISSYTGEEGFPLGTYKNNNVAKSVVADIFVMYGSTDKYEMPKEWEL